MVLSVNACVCARIRASCAPGGSVGRLPPPNALELWGHWLKGSGVVVAGLTLVVKSRV